MTASSLGLAAESATVTAVDDAAQTQTLPANAVFGFERLKLPGDETMGLLYASYLLELSPGWWVGPSFNGAATGQRGGLFTWGAEGQRRWRLSDRWQVAAGVYMGGGGGAGAPVGGGLMLRPHADLMYDAGGWSVGVTASHVRFPSGTIRSSQFGVLMSFNDEFAFTTPGRHGQRIEFAGSGGLGAERIHVTVGRYASGLGRDKRFDYVGARLERRIGRALYVTMEANGAATGDADGYAEVTGGVLALWPVGGARFRLGAHAAAGLGGGGAVRTAGGPIAKLALASRLQLSRQLSLELQAGKARAFNGDFNTRYVQFAAGMQLGDVPTDSASRASRVRMHDMEWSLSVQEYARARRRDGSVRSLSAVGLKFRRSLSEHWYLTGQAHSAITGGAGAYSVGLVGLGAATPVGQNSLWSLGAEALAGAAGGGGVSSRGGAIVQPMVWVGRNLGRHASVKAGVGYVKSLRGELSSPVIDLTWAVAFGTP
ncbi:MAG: hypothetical protein OEL91_07070, partial [Burkholderiaceae bacterium]|nr:hypothetical protein [Burkholderiaceae bacterium]